MAFDPSKSQSKGFERVRILFDVSRSLRNTKAVTERYGETVQVGIEYERMRKRCYQCLRLIHDKQRCPLNLLNQKYLEAGVSKMLNLPQS